MIESDLPPPKDFCFTNSKWLVKTNIPSRITSRKTPFSDRRMDQLLIAFEKKTEIRLPQLSLLSLLVWLLEVMLPTSA